MEKTKVSYKTEVFTKNDQVKANGFSSLEFIMKGDDNIIIHDGIELDSNTPSFEFINRPTEVIATNISFKFAGTGVDPKLVVVKTYYE